MVECKPASVQSKDFKEFNFKIISNDDLDIENNLIETKKNLKVGKICDNNMQLELDMDNSQLTVSAVIKLHKNASPNSEATPFL